MGIHSDHNDNQSNYDFDFGYDGNVEELRHKRQVRRMLEDKLERKRLRDDIRNDFEDDFEDVFDWDDIKR